jgi:hypothetical protein
VLPLEIREGSDDAKRLGFVLEDGFDAAAGNDEDVELSELLVCLLYVDIGSTGSSLSREDMFLFSCEVNFEGFGCWYDIVLARLWNVGVSSSKE